MRRGLAALLAVLVAAGCTGSGGGASDGSVELTVFGAASLRNALEAISTAYSADNPEVSITPSTDSSAALATQIEQGAPADVFLSADTTNAERLADAGLTAGDPVVFASNALTVIVPSGNPAVIETPADLARPGVRVIAAGDEVPITHYAVQLVENLAAEPGYPADFVAAYTANVASREDNVRAVVAKVELGEGDAGIVYVTDAASTDGVEVVAVPESANVSASYAGVVVAASPNREAAEAFLAWVAGSEGQAVLAEFGFLPPRP